MRRTFELSLLGVAAACLSGCGASLSTTALSQETPPSQVVDGIPYRTPERLAVEVWRRSDDGYKRVGQQQVTLADPSRLSVMNFKGQLLSDSSLKIEQRPDGTLSTVHLTGSSKADAELTNVSAGIDALQAAHKSELDARTAAATTAATKVTAGNQKTFDAQTTKDEAERLQLVRGEMAVDAKPSDVFAAEAAIRIAKLKANTAAVAADQPIPYPDVGK